MNLFKSAHFPKDVILMAIRWCLAYLLSYRHIEELLLEHGIKIDHSSINRWIIKYVPALEKRFRKHKQQVGQNWKMDETYIKVKGQWVYYYRAVDKMNNTIDFYMSDKRDANAARHFFEKAIHRNAIPSRVTLDKNPANRSGLDDINQTLPKRLKIKVRQNKYLNNGIEQDHRAIKRLANSMLSFKNYDAAIAKLAGHMLRTGLFKQASMNLYANNLNV